MISKQVNTKGLKFMDNGFVKEGMSRGAFPYCVSVLKHVESHALFNIMLTIVVYLIL